MPTPTLVAGFEHGWSPVSSGRQPGQSGNVLFDYCDGPSAWSVTTAAARTGTYGLRMTQAGSVARYVWDNPTLGVSNIRVGRFWVRVQSCTGRGHFFASDDVNGNRMVLLYNATTSRIECTHYNASDVEVGTPVASSMTVALGTWCMVELRINQTANPWTAEWRVNGIDQTSKTAAFTAVAPDFTYFGVRAGSAGTITADYDDVHFSTTSADYPLGDGYVLALKPDPAGTLTISGTTANFNTFTANGTTATWNATTAFAAIDEIPPSVGSGADGFCQIAAASGDYVDIPMETTPVLPAGVIRGVRLLVCGWAAGTAAANFGARGWDGANEVVLFPGSTDAVFDNNTTDPGWLCAMFNPVGGWTQAKLDAMSFRLGFSTDANPKIGAQMVMAEIGVRPDPIVQRVAAATGLESVTALATVDATLDPDSGAPSAYLASAPPEFDAVVSYVIRDSTVSVTVPAGTTNQQIADAADVQDVTYVQIGPAT